MTAQPAMQLIMKNAGQKQISVGFALQLSQTCSSILTSLLKDILNSSRWTKYWLFRHNLFHEETMTSIKQIQSHFPNQSYCVTNCFQEDLRIYPFYYSQLHQLHHEDQKIIDLYEKQNFAFPVIVTEINNAKGRGLIARRPIGKGELVATYSGNVVSLAQGSKYSQTAIKDYLFHLISGPDVQTNFVVYPKTFASAGFFMNHADSKRSGSKINVKTLIALHKNRPIILMQATKKIDYGKEFLYDYNSEYTVYDTRNFE